MHCLYRWLKGQTKLEWFFFKLTFLPKNERTNLTLLLCDLFLFIFWKKLKIRKRHFEISWPLVEETPQQNFNFPFLSLCVYLLKYCCPSQFLSHQNQNVTLSSRWENSSFAACWKVYIPKPLYHQATFTSIVSR